MKMRIVLELLIAVTALQAMGPAYFLQADGLPAAGTYDTEILPTPLEIEYLDSTLGDTVNVTLGAPKNKNLPNDTIVEMSVFFKEKWVVMGKVPPGGHAIVVNLLTDKVYKIRAQYVSGESHSPFSSAITVHTGVAAPVWPDKPLDQSKSTQDKLHINLAHVPATFTAFVKSYTLQHRFVNEDGEYRGQWTDTRLEKETESADIITNGRFPVQIRVLAETPTHSFRPSANFEVSQDDAQELAPSHHKVLPQLKTMASDIQNVQNAEISHVCQGESNQPEHRERTQNILSQGKLSSRAQGLQTLSRLNPGKVASSHRGKIASLLSASDRQYKHSKQLPIVILLVIAFCMMIWE